ncbi:MAG: carboxypeptidase-like regulatory domain-containing protein [Gemmatimonadetes bacterium]|nr:carboxypeptidase-like regulatory domain-containing protein [Gemmatimonadota bacterium]MYG20973.1 carboxypeptidase-like regulatory domain-containing protein [Gemmatimonadota bacterium]MYJ39421.1 carboxypeptidase-like regulatory domain-containing protein [Gemmatimonadota bacterium]
MRRPSTAGSGWRCGWTRPYGRSGRRWARCRTREPVSVRSAWWVAVVSALVAALLGVGPVALPRAAAQDVPTFILTGQILDALNAAPVVSAVIKVPELRRYAFSDVNGRFSFAAFPQGTWDIVVEMLGYHTLDGSVSVAEGNGLLLRLNPDPVALEELRVRTRSERLLSDRRRRIPYRVTTISTGIFANSINPDPTAIFRRNSRSYILPCAETAEDAGEQMAPSCYWRRGRPAKITVFLDEGRLESGMVELAMLPKEDIHSMDWIPEMGELRIYTRHFIERLDNTRISLSPLVYP